MAGFFTLTLLLCRTGSSATYMQAYNVTVREDKCKRKLVIIIADERQSQRRWKMEVVSARVKFDKFYNTRYVTARRLRHVSKHIAGSDA